MRLNPFVVALLYKYFAALILAVALVAPIKSYSQNAPYKVMESFEGGIPGEMQTIGGTLEIDAKRYKHGQQALQWNWVGNSKLILDRDLGYHPQRTIDITKDSLLKDLRGGGKSGLLTEPPRGFFLWIYNPEARKQRLRFQFGRGEKVDAEFDFNINFKGWRTIWIIYDKGDIMGTPHKDMNRMTILAPNIGKGTFYIDAVGTSLPMNFRQNTPNPQLPNIDPHPRLVTQYEHRLFEWSKNLPTMEVKPLTDKIKNALNDLDNVVGNYMLQGKDTNETSPATLEDLRKRYGKFNITKDSLGVFGRPLLSSNVYLEYFEQGGIPKEKLTKEFIPWRTYSSLLKDIAIAHHFSKDKSTKLELAKLFLNLFDYGVDQGIDEGVGLSWIHHYAYRLNNYPPAIFLMRDVLQKHGKRKKAVKILKWFFGFNRVYNEKVVYGTEGRKGIDADDAHGVLLNMFISALTMENSAEKDRDLRQFSSFFSNVVAQPSNAIDDGIKTDGTAFHHAVHTVSYGTRLINGLTQVLYLLSQSPYRASESAHLNIKKAVNTLFFIQGPNSFRAPTAFSQTRFNIEEIPIETQLTPALLALSGSADGNDKIDKEMAAYAKHILALSTHGYNNESNSPEERDQFNAFLEKLNSSVPDAKPKSYNGVRVLPYSASIVKRNSDHWMASLRAHSKYVIPFESWGANHFGYPLFIANGMLDISYPNHLDSTLPLDEKSRWHPGYDWHRWPGTTSVRWPYDKMMTLPEQIRQEGGEYLTSDQAFCGGVESDSGNGIFSFLLHGHDKYDIQTLRAKKSYFMFGNNIICLGSSIEADLPGIPVETTLFQDFLANRDVATDLGGTGKIKSFPMQKKLSAKNSNWLIDSRGTGYFIPESTESSALKFVRQEQIAPDGNAENETKGDFATAIFDHGNQPKEASYAYIVVPNSDADSMKNLTVKMEGKNAPIRIIQQDGKAHVVQAPELGLTGYATFAPATNFRKGWIKSVDQPSIILLNEKNGTLELNVTNPDLNIYDGQDDLLPDGSRCELSIYEREWFFWPSRPTKSKLSIKGKWKFRSDNSNNKVQISYHKGNTILEFEFKDGATEQVLMVKG